MEAEELERKLRKEKKKKALGSGVKARKQLRGKVRPRGPGTRGNVGVQVLRGGPPGRKRKWCGAEFRRPGEEDYRENAVEGSFFR